MILVDGLSLFDYLVETEEVEGEAEASGEFQRDRTDPSILHADDGGRSINAIPLESSTSFLEALGLSLAS